MLKALFKKQMLEINRTFFINMKTGEAKSRKRITLSIVGFALLMVVVIGGIFAGLSISLTPLIRAGMGWFYFIIMSVIALMLGIFGSVFNTYSSLYNSKDNDLILSLPIPVRYIMISRLFGVYMMSVLYSGIVIIPAVIVYWFVAEFKFSSLLSPLIFAFLITVFVTVLSCILGWVVAKISSKLKNKSLIVVLISLIGFGAYYILCFRSSELISGLIENSEQIGNNLKSSAYIVYKIGAAASGDLLALLVVTLVTALLAAIVYYVMSRSFIRIVTTVTGSSAKKTYKEKTTRARKIGTALLAKEFRHFISSPTYMLNCGLGTLFIIAVGVLALIRSDGILELLDLMELGRWVLAPVAIAISCLVVSMNYITAPSVSLEGKSLWLSHSLPIKPSQILLSKYLLHMIITGCASLICSALFIIAFRTDAADSLFIITVPLLFASLSAEFGLFINLRNPNFHWSSEAMVVKQGLGIFLTMFGGWLFALVLVGLYIVLSLLLPGKICMTFIFLILAALDFLLFMYLKKRGTKIFARL